MYIRTFFSDLKYDTIKIYVFLWCHISNKTKIFKTKIKFEKFQI